MTATSITAPDISPLSIHCLCDGGFGSSSPGPALEFDSRWPVVGCISGSPFYKIQGLCQPYWPFVSARFPFAVR